MSAVADCRTSEGARFVAGDRMLDTAATGPRWLQQPEVAQCVVDALFEAERLLRYQLGAWVVMPNHVHLVLRPAAALPKVVAAIKANSARDANQLLNRSGQSFWARDYYDHWIRNSDEEQRMIRYIERNPVKAGLCKSPEDWPWSNANPDTRRPPRLPEAARRG